ncbi:hypothetical protein [Lentzea sp. CA-135723]|uniref:hypothetical protein n=1 Tax=Lentzea sp. CA-135723 TaxID=3239950 RepID=UPI003D8B64FB
MFEPYLAGYRYFVLFREDSSMENVDEAKGLHRSLGASHEEKYEGHGVWRRTYDLADARDHDARYDYRESLPGEVELLMRRTDAEQPEPASPHVEEPGVRALLEARRRAQPQNGHHYFAEFSDLAHVEDLARAHALVRCPADGRGQWEAYVHKGVWTRGKAPSQSRSLPIGGEDVSRLVRAREAAHTRYFEIWDRRPDSHELVRHTASSDEVSDDLTWRTADVLGHLRPSWQVQEHSENGFVFVRALTTSMARGRAFADSTGHYFAVFPDQHDIYDLDKVLFVVRRHYNPYYGRYEGSTYDRWTPAGWQPTEPPISRGFGLLPISDQEFARLTAPRP